MSEIEKMKRYIERTNMKERLDGPYQIDIPEAFDLVHEAHKGADHLLNAISLAFNYGKAKRLPIGKSRGEAGGKGGVTHGRTSNPI